MNLYDEERWSNLRWGRWELAPSTLDELSGFVADTPSFFPIDLRLGKVRGLRICLETGDFLIGLALCRDILDILNNKTRDLPIEQRKEVKLWLVSILDTEIYFDRLAIQLHGRN